jgi:ribosomal protein L32
VGINTDRSWVVDPANAAGAARKSNRSAVMMHGDVWPRPGNARLGLGGRGTEFLLIGGLAVVIIGAIVVTLMYAFDFRITSSPKAMAECQSCGKRFEYDSDKGPRSLIGAIPEAGPRLLDCPECGAKASAIPLRRCPKCGKFYMPPKVDEDQKPGAGADPTKAAQPADICPHCGTDRQEWHREQFRKKHGLRGKKK